MFWKKVALLAPMLTIDAMLWCFSFMSKGDASLGYALVASILLIPIAKFTEYIIENVR